MAEQAALYELARTAQKKAVQKARRKAKARAKAALRTPAGDAPDAVPERLADLPTLLAVSPTQRAGQRAEVLARQYLQDHGLMILAMNLRGKTGEIDLVAADHGILAFIEVRQRQSSRYGGAAASVNRRKQVRLIRTAQYFLPQLAQRHFRGRLPPCRFDVVSVEPDGLLWLRDAFR
ncbi:MAG TPA: YraN family protein [Candidimonas sp.]|nr:YraN family protein [Candidimonas sp.]